MFTWCGLMNITYPAAIPSAAATIATSQRIMSPSVAFGAGLLAARLALERLGQLDARRAGPEALEVVELAHGQVEDVDDDVAVVDQHPLSVRHALDGDRALTASAQIVLDRLGDGLDLRIGASGADDEVIRDRGDVAGLEHDQIVGLVVEGGAGACESPLPAAEAGQRGVSS